METITTFRAEGFLIREGESFEDCLKSASEFYRDFDPANMPVAWMPGSIHELAHGPARWESLMQESIAAGRTLCTVDGRLYPKSQGSEIKEEASAFRIGACYRQRNGKVVQLLAPVGLAAGANTAHAQEAEGARLGQGHRFLDSGREWDETMLSHNRDLLPGELIERDGQWVRAEEAKTALARAVAFLADLPAIRKSAERVEVKRSPLPNSDAWRYTGKTFDRFAGFDVSSDTDTQAKAPRSFGVFKSPDIA